MKFTITKKHLNAALRAEKTTQLRSESCLVAQAAKEVYGEDFTGCADAVCFKNGQSAKLSAKLQKIIFMFDSAKYKELRAKLPITVVFPNRPTKNEKTA